jgi:hypothetical protein
MKPVIPFIHHISAIVGNPQLNLDFYALVLGMRWLNKPSILMIRARIIFILDNMTVNRDRY